jgi:hypothetical protein
VNAGNHGVDIWYDEGGIAVNNMHAIRLHNHGGADGCSSGDENVIANIGKPLQADDDVTIVWESSSGGKTQTLFKYTVQSDRIDPYDGSYPG